MDIEELEPRKAKPGQPDLLVMGIAELHEYIAGLRVEIARAEAMIGDKQAQKAAADCFFKKSAE